MNEVQLFEHPKNRVILKLICVLEIRVSLYHTHSDPAIQCAHDPFPRINRILNYCTNPNMRRHHQEHRQTQGARPTWLLKQISHCA